MTQFSEKRCVRHGAVALLLVLLFLPAPLMHRESFPIFILAGQSNATGFGVKWTSFPPIHLPSRRLLLWFMQGAPEHPSRAVSWVPVGGEAHRALPSIGAEITLAGALARMLDRDVGIIKVTFDGSALAETPKPDWNVSSGELFEDLLRQVKLAMASLPDNLEPLPAGYFWMQGESDALAGPGQPALADGYDRNLRQLILALREALDQPDLPVVIARISPPAIDREGRRFDYRDRVRRAQVEVAHELGEVATIETEDLSRQGDELHFTGEAQYRLGLRFARAWGVLTDH